MATITSVTEKVKTRKEDHKGKLDDTYIREMTLSMILFLKKGDHNMYEVYIFFNRVR